MRQNISTFHLKKFLVQYSSSKT